MWNDFVWKIWFGFPWSRFYIKKNERIFLQRLHWFRSSVLWLRLNFVCVTFLISVYEEGWWVVALLCLFSFVRALFASHCLAPPQKHPFAVHELSIMFQDFQAFGMNPSANDDTWCIWFVQCCVVKWLKPTLSSTKHAFCVKPRFFITPSLLKYRSFCRFSHHWNTPGKLADIKALTRIY